MVWKTRVLKIDPHNPSPHVIDEATRVMLNGGLVIYPTDTVYGLGANPFDRVAIERIFKVKGRGRKPLPVLISNLSAVSDIVTITWEAKRLAEYFWPGGLTIILRIKQMEEWLVGVTQGTGKLGIRQPNSPIALMLAESIGGMIIGTSANLSGEKPPRSVDEALTQLDGKVELALDAGPSEVGVPSTVIDLTCDPPRIIRRGAINVSKIENVLGKKVVK